MNATEVLDKSNEQFDRQGAKTSKVWRMNEWTNGWMDKAISIPPPPSFQLCWQGAIALDGTSHYLTNAHILSLQ